MNKDEKLYQLKVFLSDEARVYYTMSPNDFDNPLHDRGELTATGYVTFIVSRDEDMSDTFTITIAPHKCSLIEVHKVE